MPQTLDDRWIEHVARVQTTAPIEPHLLNWAPETIILTRDCDRRPHEAIHCQRLIAAFPDARVEDRRDIPHNRVPVPGETASDRIARGKRMLVLGAIRKPVSVNHDPEACAGTLCAAYHAVHPAWFCHYDCAYCYLGGSPGVRFSPTVRIFTNHQDILESMNRVLARARDTVSFYVGKVQDGLQLDPVAVFSQSLAPFVLHHRLAHIVFLTKSDCIGRLKAVCEAGSAVTGQANSGRVVVAWSLSPRDVARLYDVGAPSLSDRLSAASEWVAGGLEARYNIMPLIPYVGWRQGYAELIGQALASARPSRVTLGGICSYPGALSELRKRSESGGSLSALALPGHGRRFRFSLETRLEMYAHLIEVIRAIEPSLPVSLCLENQAAWQGAGLDPRRATCTCVAGCCDFQGVSPGDEK